MYDYHLPNWVKDMSSSTASPFTSPPCNIQLSIGVKVRRKIAAWFGAIALIMGLGLVNAPTASAHGGSCGAGYSTTSYGGLFGSGGTRIATMYIGYKAPVGGKRWWCAFLDRNNHYDGANASRTFVSASNLTVGGTVTDDGVYSHYAGPVYIQSNYGDSLRFIFKIYTPGGTLIDSYTYNTIAY